MTTAILAANEERNYPVPRAETSDRRRDPTGQPGLNKSVDKVAVTARDSEHATLEKD
jgi:hypothetical protein